MRTKEGKETIFEVVRSVGGRCIGSVFDSEKELEEEK
jgi:hypothetical protein